MDAFWKYARELLRYRATIALALACAAFSAGGLGVGLISVKPVLEMIVRDGRSLRDIGVEFNEHARGRTAVVRARWESRPREDVEAWVTGPVADAANQTPGVERVETESGETDSRVTVVLVPDRERSSESWRDLRERLATIDFPAGVEGPSVEVVSGAPFAIPRAVVDALPTSPYRGVLLFVVALGLLTILGAVFTFLHQYLAITAVVRTMVNIRRKLFRRALRMPLQNVVSDGASNTISRIVMDTTALTHGFNSMLSKGVIQIGRGMAGLVAAFVIDWRLSAIGLIIAPVMYVVIRGLGKRIRRASRGAQDYQEGLYAAANEAMQGMRVVKVHTTERFEMGRFHRMNKEAMRQLMRVRTARAISSPLVEMLALFVLGGMVLVAVKAILDNELEFESFVVVLVSLGAASASLKPLTGIVSDIQQAAGAAERIDELMDAEEEPGHERDLPRLPRHKQDIRIEGVTFAYPGAETAVLRGIDLTVAHGETVAFVGPNGSGKTTLLAMVPRLFDPQDGRVLIDGHDIRDHHVRSLRAQIGVVTQETVIFRGTIRSNIAYGAPGVSDERIEAAARRARADEFVARLPRGYDTPVGEHGLTLSGGQRQRIAIARAVLRDPAILILDEATSMIDADSEGKIGEAIGEFARGRTCLIVAHRLSTVLTADRIVVMDRGEVVDTGSHEDLLARCAVYRMIARNQLVPGDEPDLKITRAEGS